MLIGGVTLLLLIATIYVFMQDTIQKNAVELERSDVLSNLTRAQKAISGEYKSLESSCADYAWWDATYKYVEDRNPAYVNTDINQSLINLQLNVNAIFDTSGNLIIGKAYDHQQQKEVPFPADMVFNPQLKGILNIKGDAAERASGLIMLQNGPMMVVAAPVLTSTLQGPSRGTLIMGRYLDASAVNRMAIDTQQYLEIVPITQMQADPAGQAVLQDLNRVSDPLIKPIDYNWVGGYMIIKDISNTPVMVLQIQHPRSIHIQTQSMIRFLTCAVAATGIIFGLMILLFLEKIILSRLSRLDKEVEKIGAAEDFSARVESHGDDELSHLAASVNQMLGELEDAHQRLQDHDATLCRISDNMQDVVSQVNLQGILEYCSPSYIRVLGYNEAELLGTSVLDRCHPDDLGADLSILQDVFRSGQPKSVQVRTRHANGTYVWMEVMINPVLDENGEASGAVLAGRNITARKEAEDTILYISLHDALTGLYNRTYFEQQMICLEGPEHVPVALFICDLDGLKFINDTLGHQTGDAVLIATARVLERCFPSDAVIARIGGDEFAVLVRHCNRFMVEGHYRGIKQGVVEHNQQNPELPMALSIGFSIRYDVKLSMADLFSEADNNMYREKLHSQQSGHSGLVATLMQALRERDFITGGHVERMDRLMALMGETLGLSRSRIHDLQLLARFHDIGKVGIPDAVLRKPGPLTPEEYAEMQQHTEIGYRIARAATDLQPVAEWILKHHEWWDGRGYPLRIKGEEIPLECRILAIVDAYDAMVSERPYRNAMTNEEAIMELRQCSGTQFDPALVGVFIDIVANGRP